MYVDARLADTLGAVVASWNAASFRNLRRAWERSRAMVMAGIELSKERDGFLHEAVIDKRLT
jgi:hypothetical protein